MIRISLFDDMSLCTECEVERMLPLVPEPRRGKALSFKHTFGQFACLKSYLMLAELLRSEFGLEKFNIEAGEHGKPFLTAHPEIHFSISHCQKAIAVAVSDKPVGIDVESFRNYSEGLLEKTMNAEERSEILSSDIPARIFSMYWTRKEAVFKLHGTGITDNLHGILTDKTMTDTVINREKGYAASVAVYSSDGLSQPCWL